MCAGATYCASAAWRRSGNKRGLRAIYDGYKDPESRHLLIPPYKVDRPPSKLLLLNRREEVVGNQVRKLEETCEPGWKVFLSG
jgi:hypothetical protein